jgi:hypothetical protein
MGYICCMTGEEEEARCGVEVEIGVEVGFGLIHIEAPEAGPFEGHC